MLMDASQYSLSAGKKIKLVHFKLTMVTLFNKPYFINVQYTVGYTNVHQFCLHTVS